MESLNFDPVQQYRSARYVICINDKQKFFSSGGLELHKIIFYL